MASTLVTLRDLVVDAIETARLAGSYPVSNFKVKGAWHPTQNLEDMPEGGQVWVVGNNYDEGNVRTRCNSVLAEFPITVAIQSQIDPTDDERIAELHELEEAIRTTCRKSVLSDDEPTFSFIRSESMKDENDTPFSFVGMREGVFEAYFTAYFNVTLE